ncbi:enoyl-CoA hydratase-related protein [Sphingomicrobium marinum]|uniref:enoyl-CoA hydratase-related protein n=1 Tax=Sphingomicrobium marinum TaxID=1227950 RepID=UPI00223FD128|nr:enoyl-CoA hydratase-related protein [Sphingomicrobium marinum]
MTDHIQVDRAHDGTVVQITMARPEARNAITVAMYEAMAAAVEDAGKDDKVRLITIRGEGVDFTAGNDLMDFMQAMPQPGEDTDIPVWRFLRAMANNEVPVIAAVQGNAIGIGTTMLFHCDLVIAEEGCRFKMPFTELGLVPEAASSMIMPALSGRRKAARYLLLSDSFDAHEAEAIGLASHVAPGGQLDAMFEKIVGKLLAKPVQSVRLTQKLLRKSDREAVLARMDLENGHFAERLTSDELKQAITDFFAARAKA